MQMRIRHLSAACVAATCLTSIGLAADLTSTSTAGESDEELAEVVVTGTLIPGTRVAASNPVLVVTPEELQQKGFTSVVDALQHSAISTGAVQGAQYTNSFTPGAQTLSIFGLSPSYTKFLIDGRPVADYPALYDGTDIIASLDGIPSIVLDHIDVLPGGQSSIYGSDAIAGVVNISLKKHLSGTEAELRYGWTQDGGGTEKRIGLASGFEQGSLELVFGLQYDKKDPIWGFQRPLTNQFYADGSSPQTAERDWLVFGLFGQPNGEDYYMLDPASCANVAGQFGGTAGLRSRVNRGQYCGTYRSGYYTIDNGTESEQGYLHGALNLDENTKVFSDVLLNHNTTLYSNGTPFLLTVNDATYAYYYDPTVTPCVQTDGSDCDLLNLQHVFTPEEAGNFRDQTNRHAMNSVRATLGIEGPLAASGWRYSAEMTYTENKLAEHQFMAFTSAINQFYADIFGPNLGLDPLYGSQPVYQVDYAAFYRPITPAEYASFTGYATSHSRTQDTLARVQLTNSSLFPLRGGDAGFAFVVEGGGQGWDYAPDPRYLSGETYGFTATPGSGHRSRAAATAELRLPFTDQVTVNLSDRYDRYRVSDTNVSKNTYNLGVEYRPAQRVLLRSRYGTSFKAPTLSDQYQGQSGSYQTLTDYYTCYQSGYTAADINDCPQANMSVLGTTSGNRKLQPITATNWSVGFEWRPIEALRASVDMLNWNIRNEVAREDSDQLLRTNAACLLGELPADSPTCVRAIAQVTRDSNDQILEISTPKINVASENLRVVLVGLGYGFVTQRAGSFSLDGSYSNVVRHRYRKFAGDTEIDLLNNPHYSTEFKTKANLAITWTIRSLSATAYVERYGRTPNYIAQDLAGAGYAEPGAGKVGAWTIVNLSARYRVLPQLELSANINNLFNKMPPADHSRPGTSGGASDQPFSTFNYNNYGRSYFIGANYKFDSH